MCKCCKHKSIEKQGRENEIWEYDFDHLVKEYAGMHVDKNRMAMIHALVNFSGGSAVGWS